MDAEFGCDRGMGGARYRGFRGRLVMLIETWRSGLTGWFVFFTTFFDDCVRGVAFRNVVVLDLDRLCGLIPIPVSVSV